MGDWGHKNYLMQPKDTQWSFKKQKKDTQWVDIKRRIVVIVHVYIGGSIKSSIIHYH
jgi:hypothetical protein